MFGDYRFGQSYFGQGPTGILDANIAVSGIEIVSAMGIPVAFSGVAVDITGLESLV